MYNKKDMDVSFLFSYKVEIIKFDLNNIFKMLMFVDFIYINYNFCMFLAVQNHVCC